MRLWDRASGKLLHTLSGHTSVVIAIAFSPDGKQILSGSFDKTLRLWRGLDWESLLKEGCNQLQFHPTLVAPKNELAGESCLEYAGWEDKVKAKFLVRQGWALVEIEKNVQDAVTKFNKAQKLDSKIDAKELETKAAKLVAISKVEEGVKLAKEGKIKEAISAYKEAQKLLPDIDLNPETKEIDNNPKNVAQQLAEPL